jgi:hypothetical protein
MIPTNFLIPVRALFGKKSNIPMFGFNLFKIVAFTLLEVEINQKRTD